MRGFSLEPDGACAHVYKVRTEKKEGDLYNSPLKTSDIKIPSRRRRHRSLHGHHLPSDFQGLFCGEEGVRLVTCFDLTLFECADIPILV